VCLGNQLVEVVGYLCRHPPDVPPLTGSAPQDQTMEFFHLVYLVQIGSVPLAFTPERHGKGTKQCADSAPKGPLTLKYKANSTSPVFHQHLQERPWDFSQRENLQYRESHCRLELSAFTNPANLISVIAPACHLNVRAWSANARNTQISKLPDAVSMSNCGTLFTNLAWGHSKRNIILNEVILKRERVIRGRLISQEFAPEALAQPGICCKVTSQNQVFK